MGKIKFKNSEEFINAAIKIHGKYYDYSLVKYINTNTKINIKCVKHDHIFQQTPNNHLNGCGCPKCAIEKTANTKKSNTKKFIIKAKKIHGEKYNYYLSKYRSSYDKIKIKCNKCGIIFKQKVNYHLNGCGCPKCANNQKLNTILYVEKAKKIHGNKYDYLLVNYKNGKSKIKIGCVKCDEFFIQRCDHHLNGSGCPNCKSSKGENSIKKILKENKIHYISQYSFPDCIGSSRTLKFDFYLPNYNILIEYDGIQHFHIVEQFGGEEAYKIIKKYDKIKNNYAISNDIKIIRIPYYEYNNVKNIIKEKIVNI